YRSGRGQTGGGTHDDTQSLLLDVVIRGSKREIQTRDRLRATTDWRSRGIAGCYSSSGLSTATGGRGIKRENTQPEQSSKTNDGGTSKKPVLVMSPRTAGAKDKGKRAVGSGGRGKPVPGKSLVSKKQGGVQDKGKKQ
ncbi:unnamed protein product, partial [Pylaiella littoralis]